MAITHAEHLEPLTPIITTLWEREVEGRWIPWMVVRFDRDPTVTDEGPKPRG